MRGVLMQKGATQLLLMLSFAHSQAKLFVIWFIAAEVKKEQGLCKFITPTKFPSHLMQKYHYT